MMRLALAALVVAISTSFLYSAASPAYACSCGGWPDSASEAKSWIHQTDLAVIAHPNGYTSDEDDGLLVMEVTHVLNGPDVETITLPQKRWTLEGGQAEGLRPEVRGSDCSYSVFGREDDLYFLNLTKNTKGEWEISTCHWSSALATLSQDGILQPIGLALIDQFGSDALEPGGPLAEDEQKDAPEPFLWIAAFLVPVGFLLVWAMIRPRGGGH